MTIGLLCPLLLSHHTNDIIAPKFLFELLKSQIFRNHLDISILGANIRNLKSSIIYDFSVPLPPLEVQNEIVNEIEGYQKVIDGARQVVENYKPVIHIDPDWPLVKLGEVCEIKNGSTPSRKNPEYWDNGTIPWFTIKDIRNNGRLVYTTEQKITTKALNETSVKLLPRDSVLICCTASVGEHAMAKISLTTNQQFNGLIINGKYKDLLLPDFLFYLAGTFKDQLMKLGGTTAFKFISVKDLKTILIPIPPIKIQNEIINELKKEERIICDNKKLLESFEIKITNRIKRVWEAG